MYAIANQKGGVGKTTTAVNVGACIAEAGYETLLVDVDPQANATVGLGLARDTRPGVDDLPPGRESSGGVRRRSSIEGLWIIPPGRDLAAANLELPRLPGSETRLRDALKG